MFQAGEDRGMFGECEMLASVHLQVCSQLYGYIMLYIFTYVIVIAYIFIYIYMICID